MNEKDKEAVAKAKKIQSRTEQTGEQAGQALTTQFSQISDQLSDNIVDYLGADALQKAFTRLASGDFGKLAPKMMQAFEDGINNPIELEIQALQEWDSSPKYLLPPNTESGG